MKICCCNATVTTTTDPTEPPETPPGKFLKAAYYTDPADGQCKEGTAVIECDAEGNFSVVGVLDKACQEVAGAATCEPPEDQPQHVLYNDCEQFPFVCDYTATEDETLTLEDLKAAIAAKGYEGEFLHSFTATLAYCGSGTTEGGGVSTSADMQLLGPGNSVVADYEQGGQTPEFCNYAGEDVTTFYGLQIKAGSKVRFCGFTSSEPVLMAQEITCCCKG